MLLFASRIVFLIIIFVAPISPLHIWDFDFQNTGLLLRNVLPSESGFVRSTAMALANEDPSRDLIVGFLGGAISRFSKEIILHPIDTIKTRLQVTSGANRTALFESPYDGLYPSLIGGVPATAVFFSVKDFLKGFLQDSEVVSSLQLTKEEVTILAVISANLPYWLIRTPFEVKKTKDQIRSSFLGDYSSPQLGELVLSYRSYLSNVLYSLPADVIKFVCYERANFLLFQRERRVEGFEAAISGAIASAIAQLCTTPVRIFVPSFDSPIHEIFSKLDVVRTRIMSKLGNTANQTMNPFKEMSAIVRMEGFRALFLGTFPRLLRAIASGAVQFATYEISKNFFVNL